MEQIDFGEGTIEPVNFDVTPSEYAESQLERDRNLQESAGVEPSGDLEGVRNQIDAELRDIELNNLYEASAQLLIKEKADPRSIAESLKTYGAVHGIQSPASSLEEAAADREVEEALQRNHQAFLNTLLMPFNEDRGEILAKSNKIETGLQELEAYVGGDRDWKQFGKRFVYDALIPPMVQTQLSKNMLYDLGYNYTGMSYIEMWQGFLNDFTEKSKTMNTTEFGEYVDNMVETIKQTNPLIVEDFVNVMRGGIDTSKDIWSVVDLGSALTGLVGRSAAKTAKAAGNTAKAEEVILDALTKAVDKPTILEDAVTVTAATPFPTEGVMSFSNKIKEQLSKTLADSDALSIIDRYSQNRLLTPDQREMARVIETEKLANKYAENLGSAVDITDVSVVENETGSYNVKALIGTGIKGDAAMDDVAATLMAKRMGLSEGSYKLVQPTGEGIYIQVEKPLKYDTYSIIGAEKDKSSWITRAIGRWTRGSTGMSEEAHEKITTAVRQYNAMRSELTRQAEGMLRSMSKDEYKFLNKAMDVFRNERRWWADDKELLNAGFNQKQVDFANMFRRINDIDYIVNDNKVVNALRQAGYMVGEDTRTIVKDVSSMQINLENFSKMTVKSLIKEGDKEVQWTADTLKEAVKSGKVKLMRVHDAMGGNRDLQFSHMVVPSTYKTYEVPRFVTSYVPGGRVDYAEGNWFIKTGTGFTKNGAKYNGFARTLHAVTDKREAYRYAEEANKAIDIFNDWNVGIIDDATAQMKIVEGDFKSFHVNTLDDLKKVMKSEGNADWLIDPDYKVQVTGDKEKYLYKEGKNLFEDSDSEINESLQDLINTLSDRNSHRGDMLTKINGDEAKTLNLAESFNKTLNRAAKTLTTNDLEKWYGQQFRRNFAHIVEGGKNLTDKQLLTADLKDINKLPEAYKNEWRAAKNMQMRWDRLNNSMTDADKAVKRFMDELAHDVLGDKVFDKIPGLKDSKLVDKALDKLAKTDPVSCATGMQFTASMGFYNIAQLWKQGILGSFNTFAIAPKESLKFMAGQPSIYSAMTARLKGAKEVANECIKTAAKLTGYSEKDLSKFIDYTISMGSRDSIRNKVGATSKRLAEKRWNDLFNNQYYFTEAGNNYNQMMADFAAFFQNTDKNFSQIAGIADDMFLNMTKGSESFLQTRTLGRLLTQWLTYPMRLTEALLPSSRLTSGQKTRLAAMQMIGVGGVAGTFFGKEGQLWSYNTLRDLGMPDSVADTISSGLIHYLGKQYGVDIKEGASLLDNVSWVFDMMSEDNSKPAYILNQIIPASAIASTASAVGNTILNASKFFFEPELLDTDFFHFLKEAALEEHQVGGIKNVANSIVALSAGKLYNSRRDILKDNAEWQDAAKYLLGFKPVEKDLSTSLAMYYRKPLDFADQYFKEVLEPLQKRINTLQEPNTLEDPHKAAEVRNKLLNEYYKEYWKAQLILRKEFNSGPAAEHLARKSFDGFIIHDAVDSNLRRTRKMNPNVVQYLIDFSGVK